MLSIYDHCNVLDVRQVFPDKVQYFVDSEFYDYFEADLDLGSKTTTIYVCREKGTVSDSMQRWYNRNAAIAQKMYELIDDLHTLSCSDDEIVGEMTKFLEINYPDRYKA